MKNERNSEELDLKDVFKVIKKYKFSIFFITLIATLLSGVFAYYKPNIYSSHTSVEILERNSRSTQADMLSMAMGKNGANIDNEIAVLQSRFIVQKALETLDLTIRYFSENKLHKETELYQNTPFTVSVLYKTDFLFGKKFQLKPIDQNHFRLVLKPISPYSSEAILAKVGLKHLTEEDLFSYDQVHRYNEEITTPYFTLKVEKKDELEKPLYTFKVTSVTKLYDNFITNLSVKVVSDWASVVELSYQDNVSKRAEDILNAITKTYIEEGIKQKTIVAGLTLGFIDSQLNVINANLRNSEKNLENYKIQHSVVDLKGKVALKTQKVVEYEAQQLELQTEINILNNIKQYIQTHDDLSGLSIGSMKFSDGRIALLLTSLRGLIDTKAKLLMEFTPQHPEVRKVEVGIELAKKAIRLSIANSLEQLNQRSLHLGNMIRKFDKSLQSLPTEEKKLAELLRPLKVNQQIYEFLLQKKAETAILKSSTISNARILDTAIENKIPIKPKRKLIVTVGFILGLIIGISLAFFREYLIVTLQSREELEELTDMPIYGEIPLMKTDKDKSLFKEAFRNLRTNLQFLPGNEQHRIISVTSSVSGEGKTLITSNLGMILATAEKKVVVLDIDLRKSSLHKEFDVVNNIGITTYLSDHNTLEEILQETGYENLDIITTGPLPPNPSELLLSQKFKELLEILKKQYDYIIIDTAPAGLVTDAVIIMKYCDLSLFVTRIDYTRKEFVEDINKLVNEHKDNKFGMILNGSKIVTGYYGYGGGYGYGKAYGAQHYYK